MARWRAARALAPMLTLVLLVVAARPCVGAHGDDGEPPAPRVPPGPTANERLRIGVRLDRFRLEQSRRPGPDGSLDNANRDTNFLGSLWGLDARQSWLPRPFVELRVIRRLALGLEYDQQRARTLDWANDEKTRTAGDGDVQIRGGFLYAAWRVPVGRRWSASVRVGYARYWSRFFVSPGWSPGPNRYFVVHDTDGWVAGVAVRYTLDRHFALDAGVRHLQVGDVEARAVLGARSHRDGVFPMRSDTFHVGATWGF